jgi:hypothetical protein
MIGLGGMIEPWQGLRIAAGLEIRPKRQTIRAIGKRRHARPGEVLQLYYGMRTKQCRSIGVAKCTAVYPINISVGEHSLIVQFDGTTVTHGHIHNFARADGFDHGEDMLAFWKKEHGVGQFQGVLIRWEPIR